MATPLPPTGLPDPRGLWIAGLVGTVFTSNPFFAVTVFAVIHYLSIYPTNPAILMGPAMGWEFNVRMLDIFVLGVITGLFVRFFMDNGVLIPTRLFHGKKRGNRFFTPQIYIAVLALAYGLVAFLRLVGSPTPIYYIRGPFGLGDFGVWYAVANWFILITSVLALVMIGAATWGYKFFESSSLFSHCNFRLQYDENIEDRTANTRSQQRIAMYVLVLIFTLSPQAIADFLGAPNNATFGDERVVWTGLITVGVEAVVWIVAYYALKKYAFSDRRNGSKYEFSKKMSGVSWRYFCLLLAGIQILTGLAFFLPVGLHAITTFEQMHLLLVGLSVVTILGSYLVWRCGFSNENYAELEDQEGAEVEEDRREKREQLSRLEMPTAHNPDIYGDMRNGSDFN